MNLNGLMIEPRVIIYDTDVDDPTANELADGMIVGGYTRGPSGRGMLGEQAVLFVKDDRGVVSQVPLKVGSTMRIVESPAPPSPPPQPEPDTDSFGEGGDS